MNFQQIEIESVMLVTLRRIANSRRACRALGKALVTANVDEFSRVQGLEIENWCNLAYLNLAHPKPASKGETVKFSPEKQHGIQSVFSPYIAGDLIN